MSPTMSPIVSPIANREPVCKSSSVLLRSLAYRQRAVGCWLEVEGQSAAFKMTDGTTNQMTLDSLLGKAIPFWAASFE